MVRAFRQERRSNRMLEGLENKTARALAREIRDKKIGVEELTRAYLERMEVFDGPEGLNAVAELAPGILEEARRMDGEAPGERPLFGLPVLVKDNIDVRGLSTTAGSPALNDNVARKDAKVVENLRKSGALILGKTNMTEFANYTTQGMPAGFSSRGGQVRNAYGRALSPSGSSSGSAVAVSAGFCAAAVGTDTSFSVVGCATFNGVAGLKPAIGSLPAGGVLPLARSLDSAGPLARDMGDSLLLYSGMRDVPLPPIKAAGVKGLRIAVNTWGREQVSDAQLGLYDEVFRKLKRDGGRVEEVSHSNPQGQKALMRCEFRRDLEEYLSTASASRKTLREVVEFYEENPETMMKYGITYLREALESGPEEDAYRQALEERARMREELLASLKNFDACVMTGPCSVMHFTGLPSAALPLGVGKDGAPRGMILYGADERRLFAAALAVEADCPSAVPPKL